VELWLERFFRAKFEYVPETPFSQDLWPIVMEVVSVLCFVSRRRHMLPQQKKRLMEAVERVECRWQTGEDLPDLLSNYFGPAEAKAVKECVRAHLYRAWRANAGRIMKVNDPEETFEGLYRITLLAALILIKTRNPKIPGDHGDVMNFLDIPIDRE
jgi:hypothetical protein